MSKRVGEPCFRGLEGCCRPAVSLGAGRGMGWKVLPLAQGAWGRGSGWGPGGLWVAWEMGDGIRILAVGGARPCPPQKIQILYKSALQIHPDTSYVGP